jgi:hypothetical protein
MKQETNQGAISKIDPTIHISFVMHPSLAFYYPLKTGESSQVTEGSLCSCYSHGPPVNNYGCLSEYPLSSAVRVASLAILIVSFQIVHWHVMP